MERHPERARCRLRMMGFFYQERDIWRNFSSRNSCSRFAGREREQARGNESESESEREHGSYGIERGSGGCNGGRSIRDSLQVL